MKEGLLPHQERVVRELADLTEKIDKLNEFIIFNEKFFEFPLAEQRLLLAQVKAMEVYGGLLCDRLSLWGIDR